MFGKDPAELKSAGGHRANKAVLLTTDLPGPGGVRGVRPGVCMERCGRWGIGAPPPRCFM